MEKENPAQACVHTHGFWSCKRLCTNPALSPSCCGSSDKSFPLSEPQFLCLYNGFMLPSAPPPHSYMRPAQTRGPRHAGLCFLSVSILPSFLPYFPPVFHFGDLSQPPMPSHSFFKHPGCAQWGSGAGSCGSFISQTSGILASSLQGRAPAPGAGIRGSPGVPVSL